MIDYSQLAVSIDTQRDGGIVVIRPHLENPTPLTLRYQLKVSQSSSGGTSEIVQGGELQSGSAGSIVHLSLPEGAVCKVHLSVFDQQALVKAVDRQCEDQAQR
ncbi:curli-like amyloid fiber formation chaperone CsgH [Pseudomonas massiliensis]|uniref:curli-like amyloid fiber formation chaperone CsgH n=1 Tax=Pseudomonas massiliensis TaxID=522492 RepID=UPI00058EC8A5|nr:curli-like amyloid fiber formation chaperone CsgH [Pseudomonas massiliensis]